MFIIIKWVGRVLVLVGMAILMNFNHFATYIDIKNTITEDKAAFVDINDMCLTLSSNKNWYSYLNDMEDDWGISKEFVLALIRQESSFKSDARPIKERNGDKIVYASSALGYSQGLNGTWKMYMENNNLSKKSRESFKDSVDFIGWYNSVSIEKLGLKTSQPYELYLAYHEGWGGYKRGTYNNDGKEFLHNAATKVATWTQRYDEQLSRCF